MPKQQKNNLSSQSGSLPVARIVENRGVHLVVIEDDKFLRDLIVKKLQREGFAVKEASDGETGLMLLQKQVPQMVLLDLILPGMSGFDVLQKIQDNNTLKGLPILVLSNLGQQSDKDRARRLGAKDFMVKAQFTPTEIVERIKEILKESYV